MSDDRELIYVGDPMCSWCWGFAPVLQRLDARYELPIRTVVGGLRAGDQAEALDDRLRRFLAHHWEQVQQASGQPFSAAALDREGWVYDTEPACRSVVAMRSLAPARTLEWFVRIQRAFYVDGRDVVDLDTHVELSHRFEVDVGAFEEHLRSDEVRAATQTDIEEARRLGALGFPTLLFRDGDDVVTITRGYVPYEQLEPRLTGWLEDRYGGSADGLVCTVDTL